MALDGLIRAALSGYTGYLAGRDIREQRQQAEADKAYERERQARQDALMAELHRAQKEAAEALAIQRRTPDAPTVRNIDPLSPEGVQAAADRAAKIEAVRARVRGTGGGATDRAPGQSTRVTDDEAQGLGVLDAMHHATGPIHDAYFSAWKTARKQLPGLTPGRLSLQVFQALRQSRPDLFTDGASGGMGQYGATSPTAMPGYGYTPEARARFNAGQRPAPAPVVAPAVAGMPPAELNEARSLIQGSPTPEEDLRSVGYTDAEIRVILGQ